MKYLAAYNLLVLAGHVDPTPTDLKRVLHAGGVHADEKEIRECIDVLSRQSVFKSIRLGLGKMGGQGLGIAGD